MSNVYHYEINTFSHYTTPARPAMQAADPINSDIANTIFSQLLIVVGSISMVPIYL